MFRPETDILLRRQDSSGRFNHPKRQRLPLRIDHGSFYQRHMNFFRCQVNDLAFNLNILRRRIVCHSHTVKNQTVAGNIGLITKEFIKSHAWQPCFGHRFLHNEQNTQNKNENPESSQISANHTS